MANITAAAGGGDFNTGGTWVGGVAPTAADDALLIATSGNVSIGTGAVCRSLDCNTYTGTLSGTGTLTIGDATAGAGSRALRLVAGMTVTGPPVFSFISTSATVQTVDFAGKTTGSVTFNATSNGSWQMTGGHTVGAAVTVALTKGTLDVNGQTVSWGIFDSNNSNTRALTLGASSITITGGNTTVWNIGTITGLTLSAANTSCTITMTGAVAIFNGGSGNTYNDLVFSGSGNAQTGNSITCRNLTRTGTASKTDAFVIVGSTTTVTGILTLTGNSTINRIIVSSSVVGTARTFTTTGATVTATNTDFMDITLSTTKDLSAQTDIGDAGGNSGITFPASVTQTATGTASFSWSTHGWTTRVPLPQDDVIINNAFIAGRTITGDMPRLGRNIDFTGVSGAPTFSPTNTAIFGSLTLTSNISLGGGGTLTFAGRGSFTITSAGKQFLNQIIIAAPTGTYTINDAISATSNILLNSGSFNANGFNVTCNLFSAVTTTTTRSLTMGSGTWTLTSTAASNIWDTSVITNLTFSGASSTIVISATTANTRTFQGGSLTYGTLTYTVAGSTGQLNITGSNIFSAVNFSDITNARVLAFTAATTTTVGTFNVNGTSGKLMSVISITGPAFTMTSSSQQSCVFLSLTNSVVDATPKWYAGANSTDNGGNTNWVFTAAPAVVSGGSQAGNGGLQSNKNLQNLRNLM